MAANSNAQAIAFVNTRVRPMADLLYSAYLSAKKLQQEWNSQSVAAAIPNDANVISDGAATDGRPQITNADATNIVTRCQDLITWMENGVTTFGASANLAVLGTITKPEVNGKPQF